ncbi:DUF2691 family protein [Vallitalea sediminicola]
MKKRGVRFLVPNEYGHLLQDVLNTIDVEKYFWHIDSDEIYISNDNEGIVDNLFSRDKKKNILSGKKFKKLISENIYYTIFGEFKAFTKDLEVTEINTFEDFRKSKCEIVLLIVDSIYYDIYCKDVNTILSIYESAVQSGYDNVEFIDEKDTRTRLLVW